MDGKAAVEAAAQEVGGVGGEGNAVGGGQQGAQQEFLDVMVALVI